MKSANPFQFDGQVTVFVCGAKRVDCKSCGAAAVRTCSYPVKRNGEQQQCERPVCKRCLETVDGVECCPAHARVLRGKP